MIDLLWNAITHIPEHMIRDRTRIGDSEDWQQYVLVFEEWEFRLYNYEYADYYDIDEINREEREDCSNYFYNFDYCLKTNTLNYSRLDIDWDGREKARDELANYVAECIEEAPRDYRERITKLMIDNIKNVGERVYQYYK